MRLSPAPSAVIFDIDGTLTATTRLDDRCFRRAAHTYLKGAPIDTNWANYPEASDAAIAEAMLRSALGDCYRNSDLHEFEELFVSLVQDEVARDKQVCQPIRGARRLIKHLKDCEVPLAIATGGWRRTALTKLHTAKIQLNGIPLATSSEASRRKDIVLLALAKSAAGESQRAVLVGDGVWDLRAAKELGFDFVGVDADGDGELRAAGASFVVRDLRSTGKILKVLGLP